MLSRSILRRRRQSNFLDPQTVLKHAKYLYSEKPFEDLKLPLDKLLQDSQVSTDEPPKGDRKKKPRHPPRDKRKPELDLGDKTVLLFPGQGAQFVGMGQKLLEVPSVKELYNDASQILGYDLLKLCLEGPKETLDGTEYCQAATVVCSLAAVELLYQQQPEAVENCMAVAGFSVGEITALMFSGAISFSEGLNLVKIRGEAMKAASEMTRSGMMTVFIGADNKLGFGMEVAEEWCRREHNIENPVCQIANHLYCGAKVVAGHMEALDFLEQNKDDFKIRRCKRIPVSGAFHTRLMQPAMEPFHDALTRVRLSKPRVPVYSNVKNNRVYTSASDVRRYLYKQIVAPVQWESSMASIYKMGPYDIYPRTFECGPGRTLSAILQKLNGKAAKRCQYIQV